VASVDDARSFSPAELVERVLAAVSRGVLAVVGDRIDASVRQYCDCFGVPVVRPEQLAVPAKLASLTELVADTWKLSELLGLSKDRGLVNRDACADFAFFGVKGTVDPSALPNWTKLERVMVAGDTVWENGHRTGKRPSRLLRRR
jgi:hypothetical protein